MSHACQSLTLEMLQTPCEVLRTFEKVHKPLRLPRKTTSERPKVIRMCQFFTLTFKNALRATKRALFNISTSKSGPSMVCLVHFDFEMCFAPQRCALFRHLQLPKVHPSMVCFVHFDFEMCFAPQRRALFRHLNLKVLRPWRVLCTFWLRNVLRATTACNFSSLIWPDGSAPAALASLLFDPPEPQSLEKHSVSRLFYLFAHLHLLSSDCFSSLIFSLLLFSALTLPTSAFPSVHIVGTLTSKLPSTTFLLLRSWLSNIICGHVLAAALLAFQNNFLFVVATLLF